MISTRGRSPSRVSRQKEVEADLAKQFRELQRLRKKVRDLEADRHQSTARLLTSENENTEPR
jgi:hypothetical protein